MSVNLGSKRQNVWPMVTCIMVGTEWGSVLEDGNWRVSDKYLEEETSRTQ